MSSPSPGFPELCRICILEDGRAKATFSDNTILVTNSSGSAFLMTKPDGRSTRHVSEYALTPQSPLLAAVLEFRNMHVELPCFCKPLARVLRSGFTLGYIIRDATWPTPAHAVAEGLAQLQLDGKVALSSEDGVAQVVLHGHHRRFAVCYPLLVAERPQEAKYEYVWQTQVFSVASHPPRWRPAVRAALLAAAQLGQNVQQQQPQQPDLSPCGQTAAASPGLLAGISNPAAMLLEPDTCRPPGPGDPDQDLDASGHDLFCTGGDPDSSAPPSARRSELPRADDCGRGALAEQPRGDGWWVEPSLSLLPPDDVLAFEWTPQATYQFLPAEGGGAAAGGGGGEVEVWVHADESCMVSTRGGRFLEHHKGGSEGGGGGGSGGSESKLYAAHTVPDAVWSRDQACRYPLASLAAHALKIRSHNTTLRAALAARRPVAAAQEAAQPLGSARARGSTGRFGVGVGSFGDDLFAVASDVVLEESDVAGHGQFTAYEDGRVRVCFADRAILHMCAGQSHCKVVLPDGNAVVVAATNPVGVEPYVAAAREFAAWAFRTPEERAAQLRLQARVRAELLASQRMATMCDYTATGAMPPGLVLLPAPLAQQQRSYGPAAEVAASFDAVAPVAEAVTDRQAAIERLLSENARLLQRL